MPEMLRRGGLATRNIMPRYKRNERAIFEGCENKFEENYNYGK